MTDTMNRPWHTVASSQQDQLSSANAEIARLRRQRDDLTAKVERLRTEVETDAIAHHSLTGVDEQDPHGSFLILRRSLVSAYLRARVEAEGNPGPVSQAAFEMAREVLALAYKAEGEGTLDEILPRIDRLEWLIAEQWVEMWAHREHVLADLGNAEIVTIARDVRELAAAGHHLDDMGMAGLVAPWIPGGAA